MDHMTFTTIFSLLATVGMVLLIMLGMLGMNAFQPPLAEVGKKRVRSIRRKIPSGERGTQ